MARFLKVNVKDTKQWRAEQESRFGSVLVVQAQLCHNACHIARTVTLHLATIQVSLEAASKLAMTFKAWYGHEGSVLWWTANCDRNLRVPIKVFGFKCTCRLRDVSRIIKTKKSANITRTVNHQICTQWQWLRHCVTSRKDVGSISDGVESIFHWLKSFRQDYDPGVDSTSNRNGYEVFLLIGKGDQCVGL